jgi:hypothetical protein
VRTPTLGDYLVSSGVLALFGGALALASDRGHGVAAPGQALLPPMLALVMLTTLVWLVMVVVRNVASMTGRVAPQYYVDYASHPPREWIERPARTFNNLMQLPTLFYVVCVLGLVMGNVDRAQIALAWFYVASRTAHAIVYIGWNHVPHRFTSWIASCVALGVLWFRFAAATAL